MTSPQSDILLSERNFNSHAHVERDGDTFPTYCPLCDFNSHAHVERDGAEVVTGQTKDNFNSHAHVERDSESTMQWLRPLISTHTLTWSVTFHAAER